MRRAWVVPLASALLSGCGFQGKPSTAGPAADAATDGSPPLDDSSGAAVCWTIADDANNAHWSACTTALVPSLDVAGTLSIDTDGGDSTPPGHRCAPLTAGSQDVCALAAASITIAAGAALSARGARPLALLGHTIDIQGTIDVASHVLGQRGAGDAGSCNPNQVLATKGGGGAGGTYASPGGKGGDQGGTSTTGGPAGNTEGGSELRGGCDGRRGGDGSPTGGPNGAGGAGGGVVWISSDMAMLTLGHNAVINASGAGGSGAASDGTGGHGGGTGGMIVLQSMTIMHDPAAQIFANGGGGGGGGAGGTPGIDGADALDPASGGAGGHGGTGEVAMRGNGGSGYPDTSINGDDGDGQMNGGGGGGGGGQGDIRVATTTNITGWMHVSPPPVKWKP